MHRRKTQFAQRVDRYATALERRGIRATYALHDKLLSNRAARGELEQDVPTLDPLQQRLLESLKTEGHAVISFSELFPDPAPWQALDDDSLKDGPEAFDTPVRYALG